MSESVDPRVARLSHWIEKQNDAESRALLLKLASWFRSLPAAEFWDAAEHLTLGEQTDWERFLRGKEDSR